MSELSSIIKISAEGKPTNKYPAKPKERNHPVSLFAVKFYKNENMEEILLKKIDELEKRIEEIESEIPVGDWQNPDKVRQTVQSCSAPVDLTGIAAHRWARATHQSA